MAKVMNGNWIRAERRVGIYERDGWSCVYCGRGPRDRRPLRETGTVLSLDHLIPRSEGGTNATTNLVTSCISCNSQRGARSWREYAPGGAVERIEWLVQQEIDVPAAKAMIESMRGSAVEEIR